MGSQETIWTPFGLAFQVGERLALVLNPSRRDVFVGNNQVLERIGIDLLGEIAMKAESGFGIRVAMLLSRKDSNNQVLEKIGIT